MKLLISQPRYMPSYEFVRRLSYVDVFVMMDQTMLDHRGFENRTLIRFDKNGKDEDKWLTIPVEKRKTIGETMITEEFEKSHETYLKFYYKTKNPIYSELIPEGERRYIDFMIKHYELIKERFGLKCELRLASEFVDPELKGAEEIIAILKKNNATDYFSGANCVNYGLTQELLQEKGINLHLIDFQNAREQILKENGINSKYSILDSLNKGTLTWQK